MYSPNNQLKEKYIRRSVMPIVSPPLLPAPSPGHCIESSKNAASIVLPGLNELNLDLRQAGIFIPKDYTKSATIVMPNTRQPHGDTKPCGQITA